MVKNNTVIVLAILSAVLITLANPNEIKWQSYVALLMIVGLSFAAPLLGVVLMVPIFLIVYMKNYRTLLPVWQKLKNIKIS